MNLLEIITKWGLERLGRFYGNYEGYVVDNIDPDGKRQLKVLIPRVHFGNKTPIKARAKGIPSGTNFSIHSLPSKGEMVWIEFEGGNPRFPIWSYGEFNNNQKYPDEFLNKPNIYGLKTQTLTISIDDEEKSFSLKIGKSFITINNNGDNIAIENNDKYHIIFDKEGVKVGKGETYQPMLLGENTSKVINADIDNILKLVTDLQIFVTTNSGAIASNPQLAPLAGGFTTLGTSLVNLLTKINQNKTNANNLKSKDTNLS